MTEEVKTPSLKETLGLAYDGKLEESAGDVETSTEETVVEETAPEEEVVTEEASDEIDPGLEASEDVAEEDPEGEEEEAEEASADEDADEEFVEPMEHWKKSDKEMFSKLPADAKKFLIEKEKAFQASASKKINEVDGIKRALDPIRDDLVKHGVSEPDAVRRLIGAHVYLMEKPKEAIIKLMGQYGISPSDILDTDEKGTGSDDSAASREVQDLKARLEAAEKRFQERESSVIQQTMEEFAKNNEFFDEVLDDMTDLAWSYRARKEPVPPMEQLYEKACWANEKVREELIKREGSTDSGAGDKLSKAKRAAKTRVKPTSTTAKSKDTSPKSLRDDLSINFDKAMQAR